MTKQWNVFSSLFITCWFPGHNYHPCGPREPFSGNISKTVCIAFSCHRERLWRSGQLPPASTFQLNFPFTFPGSRDPSWYYLFTALAGLLLTCSWLKWSLMVISHQKLSWLNQARVLVTVFFPTSLQWPQLLDTILPNSPICMIAVIKWLLIPGSSSATQYAVALP